MDDGVQHWDPFGRPIFADAEARRLARVGVVDIGSNSVRLVVFDGAARSPAYFFNEKVMCGLGRGLAETGRLHPEGRARALAAMRRFAALAEGMGATPLTAVATAAVRDAEDGPEFCAKVEAETGVHVHVIDGAEEARLSAQGVLLGWPGSYGLVCDIGGSSMELARLAGGEVGARRTSPLGPQQLARFEGRTKERRAFVRGVLQELYEALDKPRGDRLFLVGGSWRAIAKIDMIRRDYPLHVLHEYRPTARDIAATAKLIAKSDPAELRARAGISEARMALVPLAADVLRELLAVFRPKDITVSSYGIREGLLYEQMPPALRARDPLIEACRFQEAKDARLPGFGRTLYSFVKPLFPDADWQMSRLVKAACLLHDVSWRAHPDYRAEVCFDNATRANLGGLKHWERVFLGLALLHRYTNRREGSRLEPLFALLSADQIAGAEVLGKAMRLGAMLWLKDGTAPGALDWQRDAGTLTLRLSPGAEALFGEVAEARLRSLAASLGAEAQVVHGDTEAG